MMISQEKVAQEFVHVVSRVYPSIAEILPFCYVKVIDFYVKKLRKRFYYVVISSPNQLLPVLRAQENLLKEIAENMGLINVVCVKATNLIRDPMSNIKQEDPRLWLELHWIISQN